MRGELTKTETHSTVMNQTSCSAQTAGILRLPDTFSTPPSKNLTDLIKEKLAAVFKFYVERQGTEESKTILKKNKDEQ